MQFILICHITVPRAKGEFLEGGTERNEGIVTVYADGSGSSAGDDQTGSQHRL